MSRRKTPSWSEEVLKTALTSERIKRCLAEHAPKKVGRVTAPRRAAVAALLRFRRECPDVLVMERVARKDDRWSGQISFPGGMAHDDDSGPLQTAIRETHEEVGLRLERSAKLIGRLDDVRAIARAKVLPMAITPFVFIQEEVEPIELGDEAESAFWLPLDEVASGRLDGTLEYSVGPVPMKLGCWRYNGHVVWGLTYGMINNLLEVILSFEL